MLLLKKFGKYIYNILSTLAALSIYFDLEKLDKYFFNDFKFQKAGDLNIINLKEKINLIDEL